jgi:hypothetical protein
MKTREEVQKLKSAWLQDSWDDLETTEGYGEYFIELIHFRREWEIKRAIQKEKRHAQLASYMCPLSFGNCYDAQCVVEKCALWNNAMDLCSLAVDADIKATKYNREY